MLREELIREFGKFGKLHDVWVAKKPPGFAFVEYINSRDAERVVHELDDTKVSWSLYSALPYFLIMSISFSIQSGFGF